MCWDRMVRRQGALTDNGAFEFTGSARRKGVCGCAAPALCVKQGLWQQLLGVKHCVEGFVCVLSFPAPLHGEGSNMVRLEAGEGKTHQILLPMAVLANNHRPVAQKQLRSIHSQPQRSKDCISS